MAQGWRRPWSCGLTAQLPPPPITIWTIIAAGVITEKQLSDNCRALMQILSQRLSEKGEKSSRTFAIQGLPILLLRTAKKLLFSSQRSREQDRHLFIGSHPALLWAARRPSQPETQVIVAVRWRVVVAISGAAVLRVVVPTATAVHAVRAPPDA